MNINWKSRIENKAFWIAVIPAALLVAQAVLAAFGFSWDYTGINEKLIAIVNAVFALLTILGIAVDTSTPGVSDKTEDTDTTDTTDDAETLGENYNKLNADDTGGDVEPGSPTIENEQIVETDDEGLTGNDLEGATAIGKTE